MGAMNTAKADAITSLAAACSSYLFYLQKLFFPVGLAAFYPLTKSNPAIHLVVSAGILLAITAAFWMQRQRRPHLIFGWLWFLGTLVPMAGFIRVGAMGMADRYAYVPLLGIFFALTVLAVDWWESIPSQHLRIRRLLLACSLVVIGSLIVVAHRQVSYWRTTARLFARIMVTQGPSDRLLNLMGYEAFDQGEFARAIPFFKTALTI